MFEPLQYEFFIRGLIAATTVGALCGLIGVYVVLRKMSYIGHGLSHAIFGGAVVSYVMSFNFYVGASLWEFACALLINLTTRRRKMIAADAAISIITAASFARRRPHRPLPHDHAASTPPSSVTSGRQQ
jgi:manganese/iron transport system permease protein/iron/zinc/copper transport system permease protein